ncbi:ShlB/FhaC/HecB family hemolysin secretion/activation protein [Desulfobulbus elongatus]|uniref:ShlB/FhaC/HecB family hemolysin secretion/activation protein n=1 Tax=Desulfobulbus elongatus TaxID=53332 RepID=UPI000483D0A9|nr:ShlB/FhaC/HecB family hemolysin secretion/activation protein [Desulfobulbus elongatus]
MPEKVALLLSALVFGSSLFSVPLPTMADDEPAMQFEIQGFIVEGNTLLPDRPVDDGPHSPFKDIPTIQTELEGFIGPDKTVDDIEKARASLEQTYHKQGYPTVLVNIPEQTMEDGMVRLEVIESTIRRVRVTGNNYFTMENILSDMPTLREGEVLNLPHLQEELMLANRSQDLRVEPLLVPGKEFGTVDVELKIEDSMPLHGSLELNNRNSNDTTDLRLNAVLRYDNLWQKEHSVSVQYQTSPQDTDEVQVIAGSYVLPTPWHDDHRLAFFSVWSDSNTAFGEGFQMVGSGYIFGARYILPLAPYEEFVHNISAGFDYKDFNETATFFDENLKTPITYLPFTCAYNGMLSGKESSTRFSAGLNTAFRDLVSDQREFEVKRYRARADYIYLTAGVEHEHKLPWDTSLFVKVDGQLADQPLISNEQYTTGGMESVRGYKESSSAGDDAIHSTVELRGPDLGALVPLLASIPLAAQPFAFYDMACLSVIDPLASQDGNINLQGAGFGLRGSATGYLEYETDVAWSLRQREEVDAGDMTIYFRVKAKF